MNRTRALEIGASVVTLTGQALGSTTMSGCACYAAGTVLWVLLTIEHRMWGLMPVNVAGGCVTAWTAWRLIHAG